MWQNRLGRLTDEDADGNLVRMARHVGGLVPLMAALVVGCGSSTVTVSPGQVEPTPPPVASATAVTRHADPQLEAMLPETLGAVSLTRESQRGSDLSQQSNALGRFLQGLGKTLGDFTLASAYSSSGDVKAEVGAWRIRGAASALLMPGFVEAVQASSTTKLTVSETSIAGRDVTQIGVSGELTRGPLYAYVKGDTVLFVQTPDRELAAAAIASLP